MRSDRPPPANIRRPNQGFTTTRERNPPANPHGDADAIITKGSQHTGKRKHEGTNASHHPRSIQRPFEEDRRTTAEGQVSRRADDHREHNPHARVLRGETASNDRETRKASETQPKQTEDGAGWKEARSKWRREPSNTHRRHEQRPSNQRRSLPTINTPTGMIAVCGQCLRPGHRADECSRAPACRRCREVGHKGFHCRAEQRHPRATTTTPPLPPPPRTTLNMTQTTSHQPTKSQDTTPSGATKPPGHYTSHQPTKPIPPGATKPPDHYTSHQPTKPQATTPSGELKMTTVPTPTPHSQQDTIENADEEMTPTPAQEQSRPHIKPLEEEQAEHHYISLATEEDMVEGLERMSKFTVITVVKLKRGFDNSQKIEEALKQIVVEPWKWTVKPLRDGRYITACPSTEIVKQLVEEMEIGGPIELPDFNLKFEAWSQDLWAPKRADGETRWVTVIQLPMFC
ncbi:hypothetical protein J5N97_017329 [Dioscorea zingiberensis]|uniref:CCHC-type domain-containing protein n=1 Tax=Dioscorea zingiberensis TaxID=325984 RepID=A0A9D5HG92_9LILI|nr:hypothetical protein J5N97_017329 [Dioscorea zingiberensis]